MCHDILYIYQEHKIEKHSPIRLLSTNAISNSRDAKYRYERVGRGRVPPPWMRFRSNYRSDALNNETFDLRARKNRADTRARLKIDATIRQRR